MFISFLQASEVVRKQYLLAAQHVKQNVMVLLESYRDKAKCEHLRKGKVILLYRISKKKINCFPYSYLCCHQYHLVMLPSSWTQVLYLGRAVCDPERRRDAGGPDLAAPLGSLWSRISVLLQSLSAKLLKDEALLQDSAFFSLCKSQVATLLSTFSRFSRFGNVCCAAL